MSICNSSEKYTRLIYHYCHFYVDKMRRLINQTNPVWFDKFNVKKNEINIRLSYVVFEINELIICLHRTILK